MNTCYTLPDVQAKEPTIQINLNRVGVTNVKKLVTFINNENCTTLYPIFDLFVDLPSNRKGANLSRNFEALDIVINNCSKDKNYFLEQLCDDIALQLLEKHEYATIADVSMKCEYVINQISPSSKLPNQKFVDIFFNSTAKKIENNKIQLSKLIGAEVVGMTACPCAQSMMSEAAVHQLLNLGVNDFLIKKFLNTIPMATHNQRGRGILSIRTMNLNEDIKIKTIIEIIESSMSTNIYEVLKRIDEKSVVEQAHNNPKFVEDCVRCMAQQVLNKFPQLSNNSIISIKQINEESIHKHNACAEMISTIEDLKKEIAFTSKN